MQTFQLILGFKMLLGLCLLNSVEIAEASHPRDRHISSSHSPHQAEMWCVQQGAYSREQARRMASGVSEALNGRGNNTDDGSGWSKKPDYRVHFGSWEHQTAMDPSGFKWKLCDELTQAERDRNVIEIVPGSYYNPNLACGAGGGARPLAESIEPWKHWNGVQDYGEWIVDLDMSVFLNPALQECAISLVSHEFGHVLGLADPPPCTGEQYTVSVMHPLVYCPNNRDYTWPTHFDFGTVHGIIRGVYVGPLVADLGQLPRPTFEGDQNSADLEVLYSHTPRPVLAGEIVTVQVTAHNRGPKAATGVTMNVGVPSNSGLVSVSGANCSRPPTIVCNIGNLGVGSRYTMTIEARIDANAQSSNIAARVRGNEKDPRVGDNSNTNNQDITVDPLSDLEITGVASQGPFLVGQEATLSLTARNLGPARSISGIVMTSTIPQSMEFVRSVSPECNYTLGMREVTCNLGATALVPGADRAVSFVVKLLAVGATPGRRPGTEMATCVIRSEAARGGCNFHRPQCVWVGL
jgi:hypothetical protein